MNIEKMCNVSTASNYALDWKEDEVFPVRPEFTDGPFVHHPEKKWPENYILTKTHCAGYCADCGPNSYIHSQKRFEEGCRSAEYTKNGEKVETVYAASVPEKAVHLFRSPFDNLVARMHLHARNHVDTETAGRFNNTRAGFAAWCAFADAKTMAKKDREMLPKDFVDLFGDLPCHIEWLRYTLWHNHAYQVTTDLQLPVHYLYYEDYTSNYNKTVADLLDFLQEEVRAAPVEYIPGKTYYDLYEEGHAQRAAELVEAIATPEVWELLKRYFTEWIDV
jgi:hypothetical protein